MVVEVVKRVRNQLFVSEIPFPLASLVVVLVQVAKVVSVGYC